MKIYNLKNGTKLMWDAPPNDMIDPHKRIVYPAIVTNEKRSDKKWVKIKTSKNTSWMGPDEPYLRMPTQEELDTLTWPPLD
jgi:hypothetical protein